MCKLFHLVRGKEKKLKKITFILAVFFAEKRKKIVNLITTPTRFIKAHPHEASPEL
jgi:hypothetical protein